MDQVATKTAEIGKRLRAARVRTGKTLADIAKRSDLSESFLSKLERGLSSASIANLIQLTDILGLSLYDLFDGDAGAQKTKVSVHRAKESLPQEIDTSGYRWHHLGGGKPQDQMEVFYLIFPMQNKMEAFVSHAGQECCYVLSGEILFIVGEEQHHLSSGDAIFIDSEQPHRAENAGNKEAHVLMTVTKSSEVQKSPDWWQLMASKNPRSKNFT